MSGAACYPFSAASMSRQRSSTSSIPADRRSRSTGQGEPGALDRGAVLDQATRPRRAKSRASTASPARRSRSPPLRRRARGSTACRRIRPASGAWRSRDRDDGEDRDRALRRRPHGWRGGPRVRALAAAARTRRSSVRMPRISRKASNGPRIMPWLARIRARARYLVLTREAERAGDDVGMAVEIFGRRMHDDVGAERERPGEHRRRAGGIDAERGARIMRERGGGGDVADAPQRVARRLQPDELGAPGRIAARSAARSSASTKSTLEPEGRRLHGEPVAQRPVHHPRRDDMGARRRLRNSAIAADMPEPNSSVAAAPSSAPTTASPSRTVSLSGRP